MTPRFSILIIVSLLTVFSAGCGKLKSIFGIDTDLEFGGTCSIARDQLDSFMAPVRDFPVQLRADRALNEDERTAVAAAVQQWNKVGRVVAGHDLFALSYSDVPGAIRGLNPQDCTQNFGQDNSVYLVRETRGSSWNALGLAENIPGATMRCAAAYSLDQQIVFVNPGLIDFKQFGSVILHELGHVIGLDHSCIDGEGTEKYKGCKALPEQHPYHVAIMFPKLLKASSGSGPEIKETPRYNDKLRAQCLYSPK